MTYLCPHACSICCVDSVLTKKKGNIVQIRTNKLNHVAEIQNPNNESEYDVASKYLAKKGFELTYKEKLKLINNIDIDDVEIQFSGGDALTVSDNLKIIEIASKKFGKKNISLSATGKGLRGKDLTYISTLINQFNCAFDNPYIKQELDYRTKGYSNNNLVTATEFSKLGVKVQVECTLTKEVVQPNHIIDLYKILSKNNMDELLLMRIVPNVGRGKTKQTDIPSKEEYINAISLFKELERTLGGPKIKTICSLNGLFSTNDSKKSACQTGLDVMSITPDGRLIVCPYAFSAGNKPLDKVWEIGSLVDTPLSQLLDSAKRKFFLDNADNNRHHCKIQSFVYSDKEQPSDRVLDHSDPLYI